MKSLAALLVLPLALALPATSPERLPAPAPVVAARPPVAHRAPDLDTVRPPAVADHVHAPEPTSIGPATWIMAVALTTTTASLGALSMLLAY